MPPYRRNMAQEGTDRKVVPVVVENGNGGTAIGRFTYVIPPFSKTYYRWNRVPKRYSSRLCSWRRDTHYNW